MNIALIAYDFFPNTGGIAHVLNSLCKSFKSKEHNLYVFTRYFKGRNIYNILDKKEYNLRDIIALLKKKRFLYFLILAIWKLLKDKKVSLSDKLMIALYMILKLKIFIKTLQNIQIFYPYFKKHKTQVILGGTSAMHTVTLSFFLSRIFNTKVVCISHGDDFLVRTPLSLKSLSLET